MKTSWIILAVVAVIIIVAGIWFFMFRGQTQTIVSQTTFSCDAGKTIAATFYKDSVALTLSDGRTLTLPQTTSASGARYANKDESIVFWNKGDGVFITEGSIDIQTFSNCIAPDASGNADKTYASSTLGVSVKYPQDYTLKESYAYDQFGPKKLISGVSFTIPASMATGTNLSSDTYISIEDLPHAKNCTGDIYLPANVKAQPLTENEHNYSVASSSGAGAGNRYEEIVYALAGSNPCTAVRYFIHYGMIENYPAGAVQAFDRDALLKQFDKIRQSLTLSR